MKKIHEKTHITTFNTFDEILDYLYALKIKPNKCSIWIWLDKWVLSINYKNK